jgi:hypothetical protein
MKLNKFNRLPRLLSEDQDESGTDVIEATEDQAEPEQVEQVMADAGDEQGAEVAGQQESDEASSDDLIVTIGDAQPEEEDKGAPNWVKELRKKNREDQRRIRELEEQLNSVKGGAPTVDAPPKRPKLEDFDYDAEEYEKAVDAYVSQKAEYDRKQSERERAAEEEKKAAEARAKTYIDGKAKYPAEKMKEAEEEVVGVLPPERQAMILDVADDPALLVYALGQNSETLRKLAEIKSAGRFIKELTKIEMNIKVQAPKAKTPPPPERTISGSGRTPGSAAANLESLKAEAEKSGDYSKYFAEKRRLGK